MQRRRFVLLCLAVIILFSSVTAQEKPISKKVIKIGGDYSFPPYVFNDEKDIPKGYYVELTQAIAEVMGFDVEFRLGKWAKVSEWLDRGEIDVVQGMSYTKDSGKKYEFSMPIAETWRTYFVRKDSQFKDISELKQAHIAIQEGDIANDYLKQIGFEGTKFYTPNQEEALALLASGKFDAAIVNL
ncbi:MAG: transporter substrate-binding domain-containing protein, partial [Candidatus Cloacimonetes bacterium]|nr:transporter substrate-binding domain-containing protein [Candidatus Cloacimonadota bacterium]